MAEDTLTSEIYWDPIFIKVENKLFCVHRYEFMKSSEVFADMFHLPPGPGMSREGQDREHPIVLEGYKKDEFKCLLKVMYPTAGSVISGTKFVLCLEKEEWISVLKLSTVWNMDKIRKYTIHRLSTDVVLSPTEKILLARAHKVAAWLDEGLTSLANGNSKFTQEDFTTLGWETSARILWMKDQRPFLDNLNILHFTSDAIKCDFCPLSPSLINPEYNCHNCGCSMTADAELISPGPCLALGATDRTVTLRNILCGQCGDQAFYGATVKCATCARYWNYHDNVKITLNIPSMIKAMFGEEIKDYERTLSVG